MNINIEETEKAIAFSKNLYNQVTIQLQELCKRYLEIKKSKKETHMEFTEEIMQIKEEVKNLIIKYNFIVKQSEDIKEKWLRKYLDSEKKAAESLFKYFIEIIPEEYKNIKENKVKSILEKPKDEGVKDERSLND